MKDRHAFFMNGNTCSGIRIDGIGKHLENYLRHLFIIELQKQLWRRET